MTYTEYEPPIEIENGDGSKKNKQIKGELLGRDLDSLKEDQLIAYARALLLYLLKQKTTNETRVSLEIGECSRTTPCTINIGLEELRRIDKDIANRLKETLIERKRELDLKKSRKGGLNQEESEELRKLKHYTNGTTTDFPYEIE